MPTLRAVIVALSMFVAMSSAAADCDGAYPGFYHPQVSCKQTMNGMCPLAEPVIVTLGGFYAPPLECATVRWNFGDGTPDVWKLGYQAAGHRFARAGEYVVTAWIQTPGHPRPYPIPTTIWVANGYTWVDNSTMEEGETKPLMFRRSHTAGGATEVAWEIVDGNGLPATGITPSSGTVTIPAGQLRAQVNVATAEDAVYSGSRTFTVRILSATNEYVFFQGESTLRVDEDDFAIVNYPDLTKVREGGTVTIPLTRSGLMTSAVTISYTASVTGLVPKTGTVTFAVGQTTASVAVQIANDDQRKLDHYSYISFKGLSEEVRFTASRSPFGAASLWIQDDDPPDALTVADVAVSEGDAGTVSATLTFRLPRAQTFALQVFYGFIGTASRNRDYTPVSSGSLLFPPGVTEQTIEVLVHGDDLVEENETVQVTLFATPVGMVTAPGRANLVIVNDDGRFGPELVRAEKGGSGNAVIDYLGKQPSPLVFAVASSNPSVASVPATVTLQPGQAAVAFRIRGHAVGRARITATPPPGFGPPMSITAQVHDVARLVFEPGTVLVQPGDELTIRASLDPASATEQKIRVKSVNPAVAAVDDWLTIPAGGEGSLAVRGVSAGGTTITATLPVELGEKTSLLNVTVEIAGTTTSIHSIVPSNGPAAGGTPFELHGVLLTPDCTVRFGGVPATDVRFVSETLITGTTPANAAGATEVELQCGTTSSVLRDGFTFLELTSNSPPASPRGRSVRH